MGRGVDEQGNSNFPTSLMSRPSPPVLIFAINRRLTRFPPPFFLVRVLSLLLTGTLVSYTKLSVLPPNKTLANSFVTHQTISNLGGAVNSEHSIITFVTAVLNDKSMTAIDALLASETYKNVIRKATNQSAAGKSDNCPR